MAEKMDVKIGLSRFKNQLPIMNLIDLPVFIALAHIEFRAKSLRMATLLHKNDSFNPF